jgi:hypothetical protein
MNSAASGIAATSTTHDHAGQPKDLPSVKGTSTANSVSASITVPRASILEARSDFESGIAWRAISSPAIPIGTLTIKIPRHPVPNMFSQVIVPPST